MRIILAILLLSQNAVAICIHERTMTAEEIANQDSPELRVKFAGRYLKPALLRLDSHREYRVQFSRSPAKFNSAIEYYTINHLEEYLAKLDNSLATHRYLRAIAGTSVDGEDLHVIQPRQISTNKKTIIVFGRQHGNESTANWIIEGFLDEVFANSGASFRDKFQLIAYPFVNPDGARMNQRYNANDRDLNRSWDVIPRKGFDEVRSIHLHLDALAIPPANIVAVLDMHGSFWSSDPADFIYHVDPAFRGKGFYQQQLGFIEHLGTHDSWNGNSVISNGDPGMARIIMVNQGVNALTHETPRVIPAAAGRSIATLKSQGNALFTTLSELY